MLAVGSHRDFAQQPFQVGVGERRNDLSSLRPSLTIRLLSLALGRAHNEARYRLVPSPWFVPPPRRVSPNAMAGKKRSRGLLDAVVLPVGSVVVLVVASYHSIADRRQGRQQERPSGRNGPKASGNGNGGGGWQNKLVQRLPWLRVPLAVQKRYGELKGNQLAAAFTLSAFLSLFPLLLVGVAALGYVAHGDPELANRLVSNLGLTGEAARVVTDAIAAAERSRQAASIVGLLGLAWSGLGLVDALQNAYDSVWQVEGRGLKDKAVGIVWLMGAVLLFVASAAITTVLRWLPGVLAPAGVLLTIVVGLALWLWTARVLPNRKLPWKALLPGSIFAALGLELLKFVGAYYVPKAVASSSELYGSIGVVFAVLAWLLFFGRLVVYSAVLNVVLYEEHEGTREVTLEVPDVKVEEPVASRTGRVVPTGEPVSS
jgi:membrane protein